MPVTVPQTESTLLSYFQTGDTPTQNQFEELIRTFFHIAQQATDAAEMATAAAATVQPYAARVFGAVRITGYGPPLTYTVIHTFGCAISVTYPAFNSPLLTATFTTAFANANYVVCAHVTDASDAVTKRFYGVITRAAGSLQISVPNDAGSGLSANEIHFAIFSA